jgi:Fe-S oxidoreductase
VNKLVIDDAIDDAEAGKVSQNDTSTDKNDKEISKNNIKKAFEETHAYNCLECGKCTGICPVALLDTGFSPRLIVKKALLEFESELCNDKDLWECLTCDLCRERCHSDVNLSELIRRLRLESIKLGNTAICSHNNVFSLISKIQVATGDAQNRLAWLPPDIKYHDKGDTLFFVGCAPYHEIVLKDQSQNNLALPIASMKILNAVGIEPVLLKNERCCGHDAFWTGDMELFEKLVDLNVSNFKKAGIKRIVTACPEGHYMFSKVYPDHSKDFDFECIHISELIAEEIEKGKLVIPDKENEKGTEIVTFHDSCKLGRFSGLYEPPRQIIEAIPDMELRELTHNRGSSTCCGVNSFINCDMNSKIWRQSKLQEAKDTGAATLLTSCPKCIIHLNCYISNEHVEPRFDIKVESLIVKFAEALNLMPSKPNNIDHK